MIHLNTYKKLIFYAIGCAIVIVCATVFIQTFFKRDDVDPDSVKYWKERFCDAINDYNELVDQYNELLLSAMGMSESEDNPEN